ncbi:MAG TPA: glutathione S-transferase family protein [Steroidobacteraceae bacterium]|nr:glutathione S-transferase family protein [Steroidobacteraceae bacterium]
MLELYHWEPNTFFLKPLIALKEKQAPFSSRYFDAAQFEQFAPGFPRNVESNLHLEREGPVLVHDGTIVSSSFFMLEYIADALPGTDLYPGNAYQHYRARAWGQFLTLQLSPGVCALGCEKYLAPALKQRDPKQLESQLAAIEPLERRTAWSAVLDGTHDEARLATLKQRLAFPIGRLETALSQGPWLNGSSYSIADIEAFSLLNSLPDLVPELVSEKGTPRISDFLNRMRERRAVREALALSRTGKPQQAFVPGCEPSRWG